MGATVHGCGVKAFACAVAIAVLSTAVAQDKGQAKADTRAADIERGRYLARAGDCVACHTATPQGPYAGGLALPTPFGIIYSKNITPDPETGIGKWSDAQFYGAMHDGIDDEGKKLYPAFPYPWFTRITREDVRALKAFLDSLPPIHQENRPNALPWPLRLDAAASAWHALFFTPATFVDMPAKSAQWNRGAYLVEGLGHCGGCHTPTNVLGASIARRRLTGGDAGPQWFAPGLTGNLRDGLGAWTPAEIVEYLASGSTSRAAASGPMQDVVANSTQYLTAIDLNAIATYLKDIPPQDADAGAAPSKLDAAAMSLGAGIYLDNCAACHMAGGIGQPATFPSLKGNSAIQARRADTMIRVVLSGARTVSSAGKPSGLAMPAFLGKLDDEAVAALVNYVRNAWGNQAAITDPGVVAKVRQTVQEEAALAAAAGALRADPAAAVTP